MLESLLQQEYGYKKGSGNKRFCSQREGSQNLRGSMIEALKEKLTSSNKSLNELLVDFIGVRRDSLHFNYAADIFKQLLK